MSSQEHAYASCYAHLLEGHRRMWAHQLQTGGGGQPVLVAEVGILKGSGLALWSDLFSASARIHGFDKYLDTARTNLDFLGGRGAFAKNNTFLHEMDQLLDNRFTPLGLALCFFRLSNTHTQQGDARQRGPGRQVRVCRRRRPPYRRGPRRNVRVLL